MIRLDVCAPSRVRLDPQNLWTSPYHAFHSRKFLTRNVLAYVRLDRTKVCHLCDVRRHIHLLCPNRKRFEIIDRNRALSLTRRPWNIWIAARHLVRTDHPKARSAIDAHVDSIVPFWVVTKLEKNPCPKGERLGPPNLCLRPVNVNAALRSSVLFDSNRCPSYDAPTRYDRAHHLKNFHEPIVIEWISVTPVEIDEKAKHIGLLFDHVHLFSSAHTRQILEHEGVRVFVRHIQDATIHEIMRTWPLADSPFGESHKHTERHSLIWPSSPGP